MTVPVHNEQRLLGAALRSLLRAAKSPALAGIPVRIAVVLDSSRDHSAAIAEHFAWRLRTSGGDARLAVMEVSAGNVGVARHVGHGRLIRALAGIDPADIWLATTDADSRVPDAWLSHQVNRRAEGFGAWAGTVIVDDWTERSSALQASFDHRYGAIGRVRGHVHGANLGCVADAYLAAGGFPSLATGEDHGLWRALAALGVSSVHDSTCPVVTSARLLGRAPQGFAGALNDMEAVADDRTATDDRALGDRALGDRVLGDRGIGETELSDREVG